MNVHMLLQNNMPYKSGNMAMHGLATMETELAIHFQYLVDQVPYIVPQEEGFIHHISGDFIEKNKNFIRERSMGALDTYVAQIHAGITPDMQKETETAQRRASTRLLGAGVIAKIGG